MTTINDILKDAVDRLVRSNRLISKGVNPRLAREMSFGKEASDKAHKDIAEIKKEKRTINFLNN